MKFLFKFISVYLCCQLRWSFKNYFIISPYQQGVLILQRSPSPLSHRSLMLLSSSDVAWSGAWGGFDGMSIPSPASAMVQFAEPRSSSLSVHHRPAAAILVKVLQLSYNKSLVLLTLLARSSRLRECADNTWKKVLMSGMLLARQAFPPRSN